MCVFVQCHCAGGRFSPHPTIDILAQFAIEVPTPKEETHMRPKRKVGTWARMVAVCTLSVLTTGVFAAPAEAATATATGLTNFGLAIGTGDDAPFKEKDFDVDFSDDAANPSVEFINEKSDPAGNVIAGTSPVKFFDVVGEGSLPCDYDEGGKICHLDEGDTEADFDLGFQSNSAVEAFAKFSFIL